jgi:hypothetical protein
MMAHHADIVRKAGAAMGRHRGPAYVLPALNEWGAPPMLSPADKAAADHQVAETARRRAREDRQFRQRHHPAGVIRIPNVGGGHRR